MLLCACCAWDGRLKGLRRCRAQIMTGDVADVPAIIGSKGGLKYAGADVDAMRAVGKAYQDRSLQEFQATLQVRSRALRRLGRLSLVAELAQAMPARLALLHWKTADTRVVAHCRQHGVAVVDAAACRLSRPPCRQA